MIKLAQNTIDLYDTSQGNLKGFGKLGLENELPSNAPLVFSQFLSSAIGLITIIGIIWFVFILFTGAIGLITSGGDKNTLESSKKKITSGLVGLVVIIFAIFILKLIGYILGLPDILNFTLLYAKISGSYLTSP